MNNARKRKVTLLMPNTRWFGRRPWIMLQYAPLILTTLLKDEFDFSIVDANAGDLSEEECLNRLRELNPEALLVSGLSTEYFQQFHAGIAMGKKLNPDCVTIMGGVYPTVLGEEVLKDTNLDYIFQGHAEERVNEFLRLALADGHEAVKKLPGVGFRNADGKAVINPVATYISDVKEQVKPDYSLVDMNCYLNQNTKHYQLNSNLPTATILTSYGCPFNCMFCATRTVSGRGVAFRPEEDVLEEIGYLVKNFGVANVIFIDDFFLAKKKRCITMMEEMVRRGYNLEWKIMTVSAWHLDDELLEVMKKTGCTQITISVESGSQRVLKEIIHKPLKLDIVPGIVKKCKELGIDIGANFVIGFPGETWEELRETFRFAELCDFDISHFHIATPLPKTDLYEVAKKENLLDPEFGFTNPAYFGYGRGFISTSEFSPFELQVLRSFEWDRINFNTPEKTLKIAQMMGLTVDELNEHRKQTRQKCGVHV
ncbi:MAG: radical SAM protein [Nitrospinae bacterium]|nr:radical SAM protein [Nitrospinota bacterium]